MATLKESGAMANGPTVIGQSILISGKLSGDEDLTVRGRVEGELTLTKTLIVEPTGIVKANVAVRNAIISGVVVGNINATESVELTREGRMAGDIHAPRVIIVDGASFRGRVDMGEVEPGRINTSARPVARPSSVRAMGTPARAPAPPPRPSAASPAARTKSDTRPLLPPPPAKPSSKAPLPPVPPVVASGAKKKVLIKKKGR